ncbi:hypothetical protein [Microbacterium sp. BLY]|uniref:hypothetical protein n=1 Tax=Microbacterium sp. BLY TaxID=2823280 RepID=UPI001B33531C|nr:hypothetical protein [Microbacterium sp. BLY]MBP3978687.1 hypothetical protein [Microbacterium sp. BLY]
MTAHNENLDELIARENAERDPDAVRKRQERAVRNREFEYALRHDVELMIQIAKASGAAAEQEAKLLATTEAALASSDPVEVARMRGLVRQRAWQRRSALAEAASAVL